LREAVEGVAEACRAFGTPVTGGNVSLYNESPSGVVDPTPTVGMVGLVDDEKYVTTQWFKNDGDVIILVGAVAGIGDASYSFGGSRYLMVCHGSKVGPPPQIDLAREIRVQNAVRDLIRAGLVKSAHDCSEGGLAVALAECCFNPERLFGAEITLNTADTPATTVLFNESQSRIVISLASADLEEVMSILRQSGVPFHQLGRVGYDQLRIQVNEREFAWRIADLYDDWFNAIRCAIEQEESIPSL
jgi:phosphoribosylformylglycinamidine synthase